MLGAMKRLVKRFAVEGSEFKREGRESI